MASQDAELRLKVSLDLAFFRQEMQKVSNIASSEFTGRLAVKFNRQTLDAELNNLQKAIKRRTYRIEIGGNIDTLPTKIQKLKEQLASIESATIDIGVGTVKSLSKRDAQAIKKGLRQSILGEDTKIFVPVSIKPSITRQDIRDFKNAVKSQLGGLSVDVKANVQGGGFAATEQGNAGLMKFMREQGLLGKTASGMTMRMGKDDGDLSQQLGDAVKSAEKIKSIFDGVAKSIATTGKSVANIQGKRLGLGNVPLMARSLEGKGGRSAAAISGVNSSSVLRALYPEVNRTITSLAILRSQVEQNTRKLSGFGLIIGLAAFAGVPLAKSIVKLTGSADNFAELLDSIGVKLQSAFDKAASNILNASSSRLLSGGSLAGLLPAAYRGIGPAAGPAGLLSGRGGPAGLLPPAYRGIKPAASPAGSLRGGASPAGLLPPAYRGLPFGFDFKALPPSKGGKLALNNNAMASRINPLLDKNFINSFIKSTNDAIKTVRARLRAAGVEAFKLEREVLPTRPPGRETRLLPAGVGRTPSSYATGAIGGETQAQIFARREREARMRSDLRSVAITGTAMVPYAPGGAIVPTGGAGAPPSPPRPPSGGTGGGMGAFGRALGNVQLPGAGLVREIGSEFAMAAKQVLLFGTAYKALAFLTSFPQQVGEAVGALQSFNNTLKAISPTAQEAATSNQFILDIVDRYNTPLQSARDGFTKLYASMAPAGFKGEEIRALFTGVSQAAATFGMSADKVDRVNYAFAQMASKGQVMSEELKGQLGDVLPGAMGIFAEAAGFKGPDAIQKFSKALEDGVYKGEAMRVLLKNVTTVLTKEFGPGAEGAARTFQGVINRMQNSTKLLYEAFEPVAVGFLNSVVVPMTGGLKTITDGFNAFFTGTNAKSAAGSAFAGELEKLRPTLEGIRLNIINLLPFVQTLGQVLLEVGKVFLQIAGNPFIGFLARTYLTVLAVTSVIQALNLLAIVPMIGSLLRAIPAFISFNALLIQGNGSALALKTTTFLLGSTSVQTAGQIRLVGAALASLAMPIVLLGIGAIIERFMVLKGAIDGVKQATQQMVANVSSMANTGAVKEISNIGADTKKQIQTFESIRAAIKNPKTLKGSLGKEIATKMEEVGMGSFVTKDVLGKTIVPDYIRALTIVEDKLKGLRKVSASVAEKLPLAQKIKAQSDKENKVTELAPIPPGGGKPVKEKSLESYYSLQDQLAKAQTQDEIDRIQSEFDYKTKLANSYYDLQEARANSFQKITIAFQKELFAIEQRRQQASISAQADVLKAQGSVAGGAGPTAGGAVPMTGGSATGAYLQGNIGPTSTGPHFDVKKMGRGYFPRDYLDQYVQVNGRPLSSGTTVRGGTFAGHQKRGSHGWDYAFGEGRHAATLKGGAKWMEGRPTEHGEARKFQLPTGEMFQLLHGKSEGIGAGAPRQVPGSEKRDLLADQQAAIALRNQSASSLQAEAIAAEESAIAIANYVAAIAPVAEQQLQNSILEKRISLMKSGLFGNLLDTEIQIFEQQEKQKIATAALTRNIEENNQKVKDKKMSEQDAIRLNKRLLDTINDLNIAIPLSTKLTKENAMAQADSAFIGRVNTLKEEIRLLLIVSDAERKLAELKKDFNGDEAQAQAIFNLEDIKKNIEETRALVGNFVSSTTGDYKGFLKAVISGEDATDALQKFQEGLKDKVLTIFFDFAMAPVDKFLKEGLEGLLLPKGVQQKAGELSSDIANNPVDATNSNTNATMSNTTALKSVAAALAGQPSPIGGAATAAPATVGQAAGGPIPLTVIPFGGAESSAMSSTLEGAQSSISKSMEGITSSVEKSSFKLLEGVPPFEQALTVDLPAQVEKSTEALKAKGSTFNESLGKLTQGVGIAVGSIMGIAAGISQVKKGGTGNTLMGIGSVLASVGGAIGGFSKLSKAANGAVWTGGFQAFANGGTVKGPTLGLVGEGKYNEAIVPLPDGRSIPVQMRGGPGGGSSRDLLAAQSQSRSSPSVLSMSFQSTTINGVEYVDRAQLEMAMAETRRVASRDGAARGANLAIDRLANSPSSRRRAGIR